MQRLPAGTLRKLATDRAFAWAAVLLLLLQVVLTTDHLGASAARAFAAAGDDVAVGLLELCHAGGGIATADPADDAPPAADRDSCVLCTLASLAGSGVVATPPVVTLPVAVATIARPVPPVERVTVRSPLRYGSLRGPPVLVFA